MKALAEYATDKVRVISLHDHKPNSAYIEPSVFKGFVGRKTAFIKNILKAALQQDVLIVGHINLAIFVVAKVLKPSLKIILIAHGIEVWQQKLGFFQRKLLKTADLILAVSSYTKNELIRIHQVSGEKVKVFPNTIDPFFRLKESFEKPDYLLERYNIGKNIPVLLSICRLSGEEGYKGYDTVLKTLPAIQKEYPGIKYLVVGKYDESEKERLQELARNLKVEDALLLTGFVTEEELTDHFLLGDLFVMPSTNEGFGSVFIEAMVCGLPVVAGNKDGSVDALANGELGILVDPKSVQEITKAILISLSKKLSKEQKKELQENAMQRFNFINFSERLKKMLQSV